MTKTVAPDARSRGHTHRHPRGGCRRGWLLERRLATANTFAIAGLRTGDLERRDTDGFLVFVDRAKDTSNAAERTSPRARSNGSPGEHPAVSSGLSYSYAELAIFRVISGIGGSIFIAVGFAAVIVWFRHGQVTLALGISGGSAFSAGAAFALYVWIYLQDATSWHTSLVLAGVFALVAAAAIQLWFQTPQGLPALAGARFERAAMRAAVASRDLWIYGVALLGAYGAYFTTSQLFTEYAITERGFDASRGGLLSAFIAVAGIPGGILGGYLADRSNNIRLFVVGSLIAAAALLALIPAVATGWLWVLGIGIGFFVIFGFAAWSAVPSRISNIRHEYIGTATGLMLTLAAVGGFFIPTIFGHLVPATSFNTGWLFLAAVSFIFALVGLLGRNPQRLSPSVIPATPSTATQTATV